MKYLFIILAIVSLATVLSLFTFLPKKAPPRDEIAISINGHDIAKDTISRESTKKGYQAKDKSEIYDTLIIRELLIQEAERQAINKEDSFRKSLKEFYENTLIKSLLDRKNEQLQTSVSEKEISDYVALNGKIITFTRLDSIPNSQEEGKQAKGLSNTALFNDLASPVRILLSSLQPGQFAVHFDTDSEKYAIRLDNVQPSSDISASQPEKKHITAMLEDYKREQQMNQWLADLKQHATITINTGKE
jgi:hypothetical protein